MKKIAAILGAGAMLLAIAGPAFARDSHHSQQGNSNVAFVTNTTSSGAFTGNNGVGNGATVRKADVKGNVSVTGDNSVNTGAADSLAVGVVAANTVVGCSTCNRRDSHSTSSTSNVAFVNNETTSVASTGDNAVGNGATISKADVGGSQERHHRGGSSNGGVSVSGNNSVNTGAADSTAVGVVVVNTQWND